MANNAKWRLINTAIGVKNWSEIIQRDDRTFKQKAYAQPFAKKRVAEIELYGVGYFGSVKLVQY